MSEEGVTLHLLRRLDLNLDGQLGEIKVDGKHVCFTVEERWRANRRKVSCIPAGTYALQPHWRRIGDQRALALQDVPGRTAVLIHVGNDISAIEGCIAVGLIQQTSHGKARVTDSREAMRRVAQLDPRRIVISWDGPQPEPIA